MKVSVYTLVYNHEPYLRDALESIVTQQTDFDFELFVHDDASTDGSRAIIEEYAAKYPHIVKPIYQTENQYSKQVKISQTYIFPRATGEYIAVCEGDDYWTDPTKLQRQVDFLDSHPEYTACVHNTTLEDLRTGQERLMFSHQEDEDITFAQAVRKGSSCYHTSSLMYRRQYAYNRPEFFNKAVNFGDYPLAIYLSLSGKIRFLNRDMSHYRFGSVGSWTNWSRSNAQRIVLNNQSIIDMLEEVDRYTNRVHWDLIQPVILEAKYEQLFYGEQYAQLRKGEFKPLYKKHSLSYRVKTYLKQFLKGPYKLYRRLKYR